MPSIGAAGPNYRSGLTVAMYTYVGYEGSWVKLQVVVPPVEVNAIDVSNE